MRCLCELLLAKNKNTFPKSIFFLRGSHWNGTKVRQHLEKTVDSTTTTYDRRPARRYSEDPNLQEEHIHKQGQKRATSFTGAEKQNGKENSRFACSLRFSLCAFPGRFVGLALSRLLASCTNIGHHHQTGTIPKSGCSIPITMVESSQFPKTPPFLGNNSATRMCPSILT